MPEPTDKPDEPTTPPTRPAQLRFYTPQQGWVDIDPDVPLSQQPAASSWLGAQSSQGPTTYRTTFMETQTFPTNAPPQYRAFLMSAQPPNSPPLLNLPSELELPSGGFPPSPDFHIPPTYFNLGEIGRTPTTQQTTTTTTTTQSTRFNFDPHIVGSYINMGQQPSTAPSRFNGFSTMNGQPESPMVNRFNADPHLLNGFPENGPNRFNLDSTLMNGFPENGPNRFNVDSNLMNGFPENGPNRFNVDSNLMNGFPENRPNRFNVDSHLMNGFPETGPNRFNLDPHLINGFAENVRTASPVRNRFNLNLQTMNGYPMDADHSFMSHTIRIDAPLPTPQLQMAIERLNQGETTTTTPSPDTPGQVAGINLMFHFDPSPDPRRQRNGNNARFGRIPELRHLSSECEGGHGDTNSQNAAPPTICRCRCHCHTTVKRLQQPGLICARDGPQCCCRQMSTSSPQPYPEHIQTVRIISVPTTHQCCCSRRCCSCPNSSVSCCRAQPWNLPDNNAMYLSSTASPIRNDAQTPSPAILSAPQPAECANDPVLSAFLDLTMEHLDKEYAKY